MARTKGIGAGTLFLIIVLGIALFYAWPTIAQQFGIPGAVAPVEQANLVSVTKPLKIAVVDPIAGSAVASATVKVYEGQTLKESLTTGSDGTVTTTLPYPSDAVLNIYVVSGSSKIWKTVTVPKMSTQDAESLTTNYVSIETFTLGTYSIKITDQFGNTYASGGTLNFTTLGAETVSLTVTIYNSADNTGYISSFDPINNVNWQAWLVASTGGSSVTYTGAERNVQRGTTTYYLNHIADDGLIRQKVGNSYVKQGVTSVTITVGKGSLTAGSSQAFTYTLYGYFDADYFATNGIGSPDAASLATFSLTLAA
jgi:hypothetical protein